KGTKTVALLQDNKNNGFYINIIQDASKEQFKQAEKNITVKRNNIYCPHCEMETPITSIRGDQKDAEGNTVYGLRLWEKDEFIPRKEDVFQERLYCIRYVSNEGRYYTAPTHQDLEREKRVIELLEDRFLEWQDKGYIPSTQIEEGYNTTQPIRERGWKYWHQLFNPRQLLVNGLFAKLSGEMSSNKKEKSIGLLGLNKIADWNSKLSIWNVGAGVETSQN